MTAVVGTDALSAQIVRHGPTGELPYSPRR